MGKSNAFNYFNLVIFDLTWLLGDRQGLLLLKSGVRASETRVIIYTNTAQTIKGSFISFMALCANTHDARRGLGKVSLSVTETQGVIKNGNSRKIDLS